VLPQGIREFRPERVEDLAPAERCVIEFMLGAGPESLTLSARELGEKAGTTGATVVRAAKALGYKLEGRTKLAYLRLALADYFKSEPRIDERVEATLENAANGIFEEEIDVASTSLDHLRHRVSREDFDMAVAILHRSRRIVWRGVGPSGFLAQYAALHCQRMGQQSISMTRMGTELADELVALQPKDALVVLSYGALQRHTEVVLDVAKNLEVILITDHDTNNLAERVTTVLECGRGAEGHFQSHAITLVLIESLILGVADHNKARLERSLENLNTLRADIAGRPIPVDAPQARASTRKRSAKRLQPGDP
jgi:DNA-binding MurR/RpiR family transcriptional regulator